ncbi:MAG: glycosyltransferase [Candidatus Helarchaeota archaeon]
MSNRISILIIPRSPKDESYRFTDTWKSLGVNPLLIRKTKLKIRYINFLSNFFKALKYGITKKFDIIFSYEPMESIVGKFISILRGKPLVCYIVDNQANLRISRNDKKDIWYSIFNKIQNMFLKKCNLIITIDDSLKPWLYNLKINKRKIITINYGVSPVRLSPSMSKEEFFKKYNLPFDKVIITYAGGNHKHHGLKLLLDTANKICRQFSNARIVIATGFSDDSKNRYDKCVQFLGWISFTDYVNLINYSDILICPPNPKYPYVSIMTNKLMQYMITGNAIIATNIGGIKNVIKTRETGILVNRDSKEIFNAIKQFISNENLRRICGENAKNYVIKHLNWNVNVNRILKILIKLVNK